MRILPFALLFTLCASGVSAQISSPPGSSTAPPVPGYVSGLYYGPAAISTAAGVAAGNGNSLCEPYTVYGSGFTATNIGIDVGTSDASGCSSTICYSAAAIYKANGPGGRPGTLVDHVSPLISLNAGGSRTSALANTTDVLAPGAYWLCYATPSTISTAYSINPASALVAALVGADTVAHAVGAGTMIVGISCTAGSTDCGAAAANPWTAASVTGSSAAQYTWPASMASATWSLPTTAIVPFMVLQAQ